jgi:hypothetical protein
MFQGYPWLAHGRGGGKGGEAPSAGTYTPGLEPEKQKEVT